GDGVGYGPVPNEVIARLVSLDAASVAGNHDLAALGRLDTFEFNPSAANAARWTQHVLDDASRAYLSGLPSVAVRDGFMLVHGSPRDPTWEYIMEAAQAEANAAHFDTAVCLFGHTHLPSAFLQRADGQFRADFAEEGAVLNLKTLPGKALLNPGSVGQPRDGDPRAAYAVLDLEAQTITWQRVEYEVEATQGQMRAERLPEWLIERLSFGR